MRLRTTCHAATLAALTLSSLAGAAVLPISSNSSLSTEGLGGFTGTLNYTYLGGSNGQLDVTLTNTTPVATGGFITAFMFRPPSDMGTFTSALTFSSHPAMIDIPAGASGSPFGGTWIGGAGLTGQWLGGGNPSNGVAVGMTGSWTFSIVGANAGSLTSDSFVSGDDQPDAYAFIVRFRGMTNPLADSDKVPAYEMPAPGAAALLGLAGLLVRRRS